MTDQTEIDGAQVRLLNGKLQYQPRSGALLKFTLWHRDRFYDGWSYAETWGESAREASETFDLKRYRIDPSFDDTAFGWSCSQEMRAKAWAGDILATKAMAEKFAPQQRAAAE